MLSMIVQCTNYEVSEPSDQSEAMLTFQVSDILLHGVRGGDAKQAKWQDDHLEVELADGTLVRFPEMPSRLRRLLSTGKSCWICGLTRAGVADPVIEWAGLVEIGKPKAL
jgi:hypothetical protein